MSQLEKIDSHKLFGGWQNRYRHQSDSLACPMVFSVYLPPQAETQSDLPVLYWLSGLTCDDQNFVTKAGAQRTAAQLGIILIAPDTSPRGADIADDESYDLGQGAGFYVNATESPWRSHYRMYDYIATELPALIDVHFPNSGKAAIAGHSMGGHGALMIALTNQHRYSSVSAFAPIVNPMACPWGQKALQAYLGDNQQHWTEYDSCELITQQAGLLPLPMRIDQGLDDQFLDEQQLTRPLEQRCTALNYPAEFNYHPGYDHSYFFISSFIEQHLLFHFKHLQ